MAHVPRLRRLVREFGPDIVHGHYLTVGGLYAALSGGPKVVGSAWGSDIYMGPRRSFLERSVLKFVLRRCDFVFAGTRDMAERVRGFGYEGDIAIFRWGVDPAVFRRTGGRDPSEFRLISIRPCSRIYNPLEIVHGFRESLPDIGNAYLYTFDFGNMIEEVHRVVAADPELARRVRFVPRMPYEAMPSVYNMADLAVSMPDSDSAAASVLEAMACEVPVIASDIPNMREWIEEGVTGFLTEVRANALGQKLRAAHGAKERLPGIGRSARQKVTDAANQGTFESNLKVAQKAYEALMARAP